MKKQQQSKKYTFTDEPSLVLNDLLVPYETYFDSPLAKLSAIKRGLANDALIHLQQLTGATQSEIATWLDITEPTLRKHIQSHKELNPSLSEHLLQLFELFNKGIDTFGSIDEFKSWLRFFNPGINAVPFDLLDTITGIGIIKNQLIRIDYGALA